MPEATSFEIPSLDAATTPQIVVFNTHFWLDGNLHIEIMSMLGANAALSDSPQHTTADFSI